MKTEKNTNRQNDKMINRTFKIGLIIIVGLLCMSGGLTKVFADPVTVYVASVRAGYWASEGWIGSVNIQVNGAPYVEYCIQDNVYIYLGGTYPATVYPAPDNPTYKSVSYILAWYALDNGLNPVDDSNEASAIQVAIWNCITGTWFPPDMSSGLQTQAQAICNDASGKDVARPGDSLTLTAEYQNAPMDMPVNVTAQLSTPRANVKIQFSTDKGTFTQNGQNQIEELTDSNGKAVVTVICTQQGDVTVTAKTRAYWASILDLGTYQDLIAIGYPTQATVIIKTTSFFVVPEVILGTVMIVVAGFAAIGVLKLKRSKE
jgi:hypothetical protein